MSSGVVDRAVENCSEVNFAFSVSVSQSVSVGVLGCARSPPPGGGNILSCIRDMNHSQIRIIILF